MTDQQKGILYYYSLPLIFMYTAQVAVVLLLIFDRSISLLQGSVLIAMALFCVFCRGQNRSMIRKQATVISATKMTHAVILKRKGKLDDELYTALVRNDFDTEALQHFTSANVDVDTIANDKRLKTYDDILKFYMINLARL